MDKNKVYAGIGSRSTPPHVLDLMVHYARLLAARGWILRSGGATGADAAWEAGARSVSPRLVESYSADDSAPEVMEVARAHHPAWGQCGPHARMLLARNVTIVLGRDLRSPVSAVLYWRPEDSDRGGTLHALRVAASRGIEVENVEWCYALLDRMLAA
jgi:hypothetical protein